MADYSNLKDKVVVITGSSRGIGSSIARLFAASGAKVIITYLKSKQSALDLQQDIDPHLSNSIVVPCDVTDSQSIDTLISATISAFGRIDVLINNAGAAFEPAKWDNTTPEVWRKTLDVNLIGSFNCIQKIAPLMLTQKSGKIVNIASTAAFCSTAYAIAYSAAKAGVNTLTQAFAKELAPYINVNGVAPGWTDTDWHKHKNQDFFDRVKEVVPLKRLAKTDEIASAVLFLASSQADFITGQTLTVDGGASLS